nr:ABC transporter permease [Bacilli bacterium]
MGIVRFIVKRLISMIITISVVLAVSFLMMHYSPNSFFSSTTLASGMGNLQFQDPKLYQQYITMFENRYGMNKPIYDQVLSYVWNSLTFNFGNSFENPTMPIMTQLKESLPISIELSLGSVILAVIIGLPLGVLAALYRNSWIDSLLTTFSMIGQAIPAFVFAVILVLLFGVVWPGVVPINGWGTFADAILPTIALCVGNIGVVTRYMRGSLIESMRQDYIRTAKAKGVPYWPLVWKHGIRNSLTAMVTVIGPTFAFTVVGTVWVENIFSIPGLGTLMSGAFVNDDIPLAITSVFILSLMVMGVNLLVDLSYALMDPRVKLEA